MVLFLLEKKSGTHFLGPEKISQSLNITSTPTGDFFPHFDHWAKYRQGWSWRLVEITKNHIVNKFLRYHSNTYVTKQMCKYTNIWDIVCIFIYTHILPSTMDHMVKRSFLYRKPPSPNKKKKHLWNLLNMGSSPLPLPRLEPLQPRCWVRQHHLGDVQMWVEWFGAQGRSTPYSLPSPPRSLTARPWKNGGKGRRVSGFLLGRSIFRGELWKFGRVYWGWSSHL